MACGLCLPHCPTFRVTGEEALSPRGRIDAMRAVQWRGAEADDEFVRFMETCVQCRGCEPACPSGVPFGHLMEGTREALADAHRTAPRWLRAGSRGARPASAAARRLDAARGRPAAAAGARSGPGWPACRCAQGRRRSARRRSAPRRRTSGSTPGCVMDAWMRDTPGHGRPARGRRGTFAVSRRDGAAAARCTPTPGSATRRRAGSPRDRVDAWRRADRRQLGGLRGGDEGLRAPAGHAEGAAFAARVVDVQEWLAARLDRLPAPRRPGRR